MEKEKFKKNYQKIIAERVFTPIKEVLSNIPDIAFSQTKFGVEIEKHVEADDIPDDLSYYHSYGVNALKTDSSCGIEFTTGTEIIEKIPYVPELLEDSEKWRRFKNLLGDFSPDKTGIHIHLSFPIPKSISKLNKMVLATKIWGFTFLHLPIFKKARLLNNWLVWFPDHKNTDRMYFSITNHYNIINLRNKDDEFWIEFRMFSSSQDPYYIKNLVEVATYFMYAGLLYDYEVEIKNLLNYDSLYNIMKEMMKGSIKIDTLKKLRKDFAPHLLNIITGVLNYSFSNPYLQTPLYNAVKNGAKTIKYSINNNYDIKF